MTFNPRNRRYSDEEMLEELRRVAALVSGPLSRPKFQSSAPRISSAAISQRFDGWLAAIEKAGLPPAYAYGGSWKNCPICSDRFRVVGGPKGAKTCSKKSCTSTLMSRARFKGDDVTPQAARGRAKRVKTGDQCERCGHDGSACRLERHHKDRDPYNNEPDNLELLCQRCHLAEHRKKADGPSTPHRRRRWSVA